MNADNCELLPPLRNLRSRKFRSQIGWEADTAIAGLVKPDDDLAPIVGSSPVTRSQLGKRLWDYIRANNLQDIADGKMIHANDVLAKISKGKKLTNFIDLTKSVLQHVTA